MGFAKKKYLFVPPLTKSYIQTDYQNELQQKVVTISDRVKAISSQPMLVSSSRGGVSWQDA
jgi:hypothetical protein